MSVPMVNRWSGSLINRVGRHPSRAWRWLTAPVPAAWEGGKRRTARGRGMVGSWGKEFDEKGSRYWVTFKALNSPSATLWNYPTGTQDEAQSSQELVKASGSLPPPLPTALDANVTPVGLGQKFSTCIRKKVGERQRQQTRNEIGIDRDAIEQNVEVFVRACVYMAEWVGMYETDKPDAGRKHLSRTAWKKYICRYIYNLIK